MENCAPYGHHESARRLAGRHGAGDASNCYTALTINDTTFVTTAQLWTIPYDASISMVGRRGQSRDALDVSNNGTFTSSGAISGAGG